MSWVQELAIEYIRKHEDDVDKNWTKMSSFWKRVSTESTTRNRAFDCLVKSDSQFSASKRVWLDEELTKHNVKADEIKDTIVDLNIHLKRLGRRETYLGSIFLGLLAGFIVLINAASTFSSDSFSKWLLLALTCGIAVFIIFTVPLARMNLLDRRIAMEEFIMLLQNAIDRKEAMAHRRMPY